MKNPFKRTGFDTFIAKGQSILGSLILLPGSTTIIEGEIDGEDISVSTSTAPETSTSLLITGTVRSLMLIEVPNVTISGNVKCDFLRVQGTLTIKKGAVVTAEKIQYGTLIVETGAIVNGTFQEIRPTLSEKETS